MPHRPLVEVIQEHGEGLLATPGVQAVYESALPDGVPCLKIAADFGALDPAHPLPERLEGYPVVVVDTGPLAPR